MSEDLCKDNPLNDESRETDKGKRARTTKLFVFFCPFCLFAPTSYIIHWIIKEGVYDRQRAL
jgi:hypothetical protein